MAIITPPDCGMAITLPSRHDWVPMGVVGAKNNGLVVVIIVEKVGVRVIDGHRYSLYVLSG